MGKSINAYVKVTLSPSDMKQNIPEKFQRTAVHRGTNKPFFNHKIVFDIGEGDLEKIIRFDVWHRNRKHK